MSSPRSPRRGIWGRIGGTLRLLVRWGRWAVLGWLVWFAVSGEWKREIARWRLAAAEVAGRRGQEQLQWEQLQAAVRWAPRSAAVWRAQAAAQARRGQWDAALQACDQAAQFEGPPALQSWSVKIDVLQAAERFDEAAAVAAATTDVLRERLRTAAPWEQTFWRDALAQALNTAAYNRALAATQLDIAQREAAEVLQMAREDRLRLKLGRKQQRQPGEFWAFDSLASVLDTHAFVLWQRGEAEQARRELDAAVTMIERQWNSYQRRVLPALELQRVDLRPVQGQTRILRRSVAVIRYHRALACQAAHPRQAAYDLRRVRQLGFEPGPDLY